MSDFDPGLIPGPTNIAGEQDAADQAALVEAAGFLSQETVQAIEGRVSTIGQLNALAETPNPFERNEVSIGADLSFMSPQQIQQLQRFSVGRWTEEYLSPTKNTAIVIFKHKLVGSTTNIRTELTRRTDMAGSDMEQFDETVKEVFGGYRDDDTVALDIEAVTGSLEQLDEIAKRVPSEATCRFFENIMKAIEITNKYIGRWSQGGHHGTGLLEKLKEIVKEKKIEPALAASKEIQEPTRKLRNRGTDHHKKLIKLLRAEQVREAVRLLDDIDVANSQIPGLDQLNEDQLAAALTVERYLAARLEVAQLTLKNIDPNILRRREVEGKAKRAGAMSLASAIEQPSRVKSAETQTGVQVNTAEARDIFRGGRRLKPGKGQTAQEVQQKADGLYGLKTDRDGRLLQPEETGIIISIITGKFDKFVEVLGEVKAGKADAGLANMPIERRTVVQQLRDFDLNGALTKIDGLLSDTSTRSHFTRVIGFDGAKTVQETLREALQPED